MQCAASAMLNDYNVNNNVRSVERQHLLMHNLSSYKMLTQSLITLTHFVYSSSDSNNPTAAITACGNAGQWQQAKQLIVQMKESGVQPNVITYTAALNACGKLLHPLEKAAAVQGFVADACLPLAHQSATVLTAGQVDEALALLADMQHLGLKPSLITYGSALTACSTAGRGEQALALLQQMQHSSGLLPDARCYSAVISALGKAGMWREALQ
eukprot:17259-Heterococcus_DN1.PRE.2